jgi:hypothetical protein
VKITTCTYERKPCDGIFRHVFKLASLNIFLQTFRIEYHATSIYVLNAPSPAATAALAIGGQICEMAERQFDWEVAN